MLIVWQYNDVGVLKLTSNGDVSWQKTYGGIGSEQSFYIGLALVDGGYLVTSTTDSFATGGTDASFKLLLISIMDTHTNLQLYKQGRGR